MPWWEIGSTGFWLPGRRTPKPRRQRPKPLRWTALSAKLTSRLHFALDVFDWDWEAAGREFRRAIDLSPGYATAHHWYAWHLSQLGRNDEAIAEMRKAENLDPLSLIISADMAEDLLIAHRYDEAIKQSRKTMDMDPFFAIAHYELGQAFVQKHMYNEAIAELQKAIELSAGSTHSRPILLTPTPYQAKETKR